MEQEPLRGMVSSGTTSQVAGLEGRLGKVGGLLCRNRRTHTTAWRRTLLPLYNGCLGTNTKSAEIAPKALVIFSRGVGLIPEESSTLGRVRGSSRILWN